jgi:multiple sugar transport system substrate-binding protein
MRRSMTRRRVLSLAGMGALGVCLAACSAPPAPTATSAPAAKPAAAADKPAEKPADKPAAAAEKPADKPAAPAAAAAPSKPRDKVTLRLWHWDAVLVEPYEKVGKELTARQPHVTVLVEHTAANEYPQKVTASVAGGATPDVIGVTVTRADFLTFASKGQLTPLADYVKKDNFDINDFYDLNLKQHTWKGTLYNLPYAWNTAIWFYQEETFKKEGLTLPPAYVKEGKWNWNTYLELAGKLTKGSGLDRYFGSGVVSPTFTAAWLPLVWSNGGNIFDAGFTKPTLTDPATMGAFEFAYSTTKFAPGPEDTKTGTQESGRLGMWTNWDVHYVWMRPNTNFRYGIAPPPASPTGGKHYFTGNAPGFGIPKGAKNPDESWGLIKHIMTPEMLMIPFIDGNNAPPRKSMSNDREMWKKHPKFFDPEAMLEIAKAKEAAAKNPPKISTWAQMSTAMNEEMSLVWANKQPLAEGVKKVQERWEKLLKEGEVDPDVGG